MAVLGIALLTALNIAIILLFIQINIIIPIILLAFYYLSFTTFMAAYGAYPVIEKYMITPYQKSTEESSEAE